MENRIYEQARDELVAFLQDLRCKMCHKIADSSLSTSNQGHDVCTCQPIMGNSYAKLSPPNHVPGGELRPCKQSIDGCYKLIVSTNDDHETLCVYRKSYCKVVGCEKPVLVKDMIQHLRGEHESILYADEYSAVEFTILKDNLCYVIPIYVFDTIIWEKIYFENGDIKIAFFHESPNKLTPRLLAMFSLQCSRFSMADKVQVLNFGEDPGKNEVIISYRVINILKGLKLGGGVSNNATALKIKHGLKIIRSHLHNPNY